MKTLIALIVALTSFVGGLRAEFPGFLMGSEERVVRHCVINSNDGLIYIYQYSPDYPNGRKLIATGFWNNETFSNKDDLDGYFDIALTEVAVKVITDDKGQNKNLPFSVVAFAGEYYWNEKTSGTYFWVEGKPFSLLKSESGSYFLPDLSEIKLELQRNIVYPIPNLEWARVEVLNTDGEVVKVCESSDGQSEFINLNEPHLRSFISIPREYTLSGTNGATRIKISLVSSNGKFQVFGPMGLPVAENLPVLKLVPYTGTISKLQIVGGEVGRMFKIQRTSDVSGSWEEIPDSTFTVRDHSHSLLVDTSKGDKSFFRLCAVDGVPQPLQKR